jgi:hypothetical protein
LSPTVRDSAGEITGQQRWDNLDELFPLWFLTTGNLFNLLNLLACDITCELIKLNELPVDRHPVRAAARQRWRAAGSRRSIDRGCAVQDLAYAMLRPELDATAQMVAWDGMP